MNTVRVLPLDPLPTGRVLVVSDVHGHLSHLRAVLEEAKFEGDDLLIVVGDLLEKGPDSLGTLRYVMELVEAGRAVSAWGNVDYLRVQALDGLGTDPSTAEHFLAYLNFMRREYGNSLFDEMCRELNTLPQTEEEILAVLPAVTSRFQRELSFLRSQPTIIETPNYRFVHGGLKSADLQGNLTCPPWELLKRDDFLATARRTGMVMEKPTVVGHWPVSCNHTDRADFNPIVDQKQGIIAIDGGCGVKSIGQLNLLILPTVDCPMEAILHKAYDGFPTKKVLRDQPASKDAFYIRWGDAKVRLLRKDPPQGTAAMAEVEHIRTGHRMWVPADWLYDCPPVDQMKIGDVAFCDDCTDYRLPLRAGDEIAVICETPRGTLGKKNGLVGWVDPPQEK